MNAYENINEAIDKYLKESGKTQQEFAIELGTNTNTLRWKRRGDIDWKFSEVLKVAEILGVEPDSFIANVPA